MKRINLIILFLFSFQFFTNAQNLNDVLEKNYKARGGLERLKKINSIHSIGKTIVQGMELPFQIINKRPNLLRTEFTVQGQSIISVYDGKDVWMINPMMGSKDPIQLPAEQAKNTKDQADIDGFLVGWKEKGDTLEYIGKEEIEGADAYKIKVKTKDGDIRYIYIDTESNLEILMKGKYTTQDQEIEVSTSFGNYKMVDSMMVPFSIESKMGDKTVSQVLLDTVIFNKEFPDSLFQLAPKEKK